jgi:hypothetical protein
MWVRRSPDEIAEIERRRRRRRLSPLVPAILTTLLLAIGALLGPPHWRPVFTSSCIVFLFLVIFASFYVSQVVFGQYWLFGSPRLPQSTEVNKICPACRNIYFTNSDACPCGGRLENLEYWKYVDGKQESNEDKKLLN